MPIHTYKCTGKGCNFVSDYLITKDDDVPTECPWCQEVVKRDITLEGFNTPKKGYATALAGGVSDPLDIDFVPFSDGIAIRSLNKENGMRLDLMDIKDGIATSISKYIHNNDYSD